MGVVVASVDDGYLGRYAGQQAFGQVGNVFQRDGYHDEVGAALGRFLGRNGRSTGFLDHLLQRLGAAGVGDIHIMAEASEPHAQGAADVAGADDSDVHSSVVLVGAPVMDRRRCRLLNSGGIGFDFLGGGCRTSNAARAGLGRLY